MKHNINCLVYLNIYYLTFSFWKETNVSSLLKLCTVCGNQVQCQDDLNTILK